MRIAVDIKRKKPVVITQCRLLVHGSAEMSDTPQRKGTAAKPRIVPSKLVIRTKVVSEKRVLRANQKGSVQSATEMQAILKRI
jgi:hypothetical protein